MATITALWNATSGSWFSAGNWDEFDETGHLVHYVPRANNDVQLVDNSGTSPGTPFVVTYNGTSSINTLNGSVIGLVDMTGGKLTVANGGFRVGINVDAGAELSLSAGTLSIERGNFAGKVSGAGALRMVDGAYTIEAGANFTVATWIITHQIGSGVVPTVTLETDFTYARTFRLEDTFGNLPIFDLNGRTLTLSGTATLTGVVDGPGVMKLTGQNSTFAGGVNAGAMLEVASELEQIGRVFNDGFIKVDAGARYEITTASNIDSSTTGGGKVQNAGDFLISGAGTSSVNAAFVSTGRLEVADGARLNLIGSASLRGAVTGDGTLAFGFAHDVTINATSFDVASVYINGGNGGGVARLGKSLAYAGDFNFENQFGTFDINGHILTLSGASRFTGGAVDGGGTLRNTGVMELSSLGVGKAVGGQAATIENDGTIRQTGFLQVNGVVRNDAGAAYRIEAAADVTGETGRFVNNGRLVDAAAGLSSISVDFVNNGVLQIADGATLRLAGDDVLNGRISGAGTLAFGFAHQITLAPATLDVAAIYINGGNGGGGVSLGKSLTYAGDFTFENQFGTFDLNGKTLTLSGEAAFTGGAIDGPGRLQLTGSSALTDIGVGSGDRGQAVTIENDGRLDQYGFLQLKGAILNDQGAVWRIARAGDITDNGGSFRNDGVLVVEGDGRSAISVDFVNANTVTINAGSELAFAVGETVLQGQIKGAGTLTFGFAHDVTIDTTKLLVDAIYINGGNGGGTATIAKAVTYKGDFTLENQFGALQLDRTFTLTGDVELRSGAVRGDASLVISGDAAFGFVSLNAAVAITGDGSVRQTGSIEVLDVLRIGANAAYDMVGSDIYDNLVEGRIVVDGLLERSVDGVGRVATRVATTEDGAIVVENGALVFIVGGLAADVLKGGAGADAFVFDAKLGPKNVDRITDFSPSDELRLDHDVFKALRVGDLAASAFKDISAGAVDANDRILYDRDTGKLFYDADGRGGKAAVLFATLTTEPDLSAADFVIV